MYYKASKFETVATDGDGSAAPRRVEVKHRNNAGDGRL